MAGGEAKEKTGSYHHSARSARNRQQGNEGCEDIGSLDVARSLSRLLPGPAELTRIIERGSVTLAGGSGFS
jgi:hypothetical protein